MRRGQQLLHPVKQNGDLLVMLFDLSGKLAVRGGFGYYYIRTSGQTLLQLIASPPWVEQYLASGLK